MDQHDDVAAEWAEPMPMTDTREDGLLINGRIDALTTALDTARAEHGVTRGEMVIFAVLLLAGSLAESRDYTAITRVLDFLLKYLRQRSQAKGSFARLMHHLGVERTQ